MVLANDWLLSDLQSFVEASTDPIDSLDIFSTSLFSLYSELPATISSPKDSVTFSGVTVSPPETDPRNWALQAHGVWRSAIYLAEHIDILGDLHEKDVLELGAASGLPGISIAKRCTPNSVTLSDYPDPKIIHTLLANVKRNNIPSFVKMRVIGHAWGTDALELGAFDVIVAADTLWLSEQHENLCRTLAKHLIRRASSVVYLVAGLHTGRHVIAQFLEKLHAVGLKLRSISEVALVSSDRRDWVLERPGETNADRSLWVLEILICWASDMVVPQQ